MKQEDIKAYVKLREELDSLAEEIFDYVYDNYNRFLAFESSSRYCDINVYDDDDDGLEVVYFDYYDDYCCRGYLPVIPLDFLNKESSWKKFLDEYYGFEITKEEAEKKELALSKEKEERELFEQLKKKYETI